MLIFKDNVFNKIKQNWLQGHKIVKQLSPDAFLVTDGNKTIRLNKIHIKPDKSREGERGVIPKL